MPSLVPRSAPDSRPLEVPDESVEAWTERGYVLADAPKKPAARKAPAKKAATKPSEK